jgi:hypothetical protein
VGGWNRGDANARKRVRDEPGDLVGWDRVVRAVPRGGTEKRRARRTAFRKIVVVVEA